MRLKGGRAKAAAAILGCVFLGGTFFAASQGLPRRISICELQGTAEVSPFQDQEVRVRGLVAWTDLESGFFSIVDAGCPASGEGSRGLLVSLGDAVYPVRVGDEVQLQGTVREVEGETRLEIAPQDLEILSLDNPLPEALDVLQARCPRSLEDWEGQRILLSRAVLEGESGDLVVVPAAGIDPVSGQVCFRAGEFALRLSGSDQTPGLAGQASGSALQNLTGLLRQESAGYYLQLDGPLNQPWVYGQLSGSLPGSQEEVPQTLAFGFTPIPSFTATGSPSPTISLTPSPTIIPSPTFYPIPLLISEILPNPVSEEPGGEWAEIYNPGGRTLPLNGIKLGDETSPAGKEGMVRFPDGYWIEAGEVLVVANKASAFIAAYGFLPDFELSDSDSRVPDLLAYPEWGRSAVQLSNSADEVLLVSPWDQVLDQVAYGSGDGLVPAPREGHSLERYPPERDTDLPGDWRERSEPSPGILDRRPPSPTASAQTSATTAAGLTSTPSPLPSETPPASLTASPQPASLTPSLPSSPSSTSSQSPTLAASWTATGTMAPTAGDTLLPGPTQMGSPSATAARTATLPASRTPAASPSPESSGTTTAGPGPSLTPSPALESSPTQGLTPAAATPSLSPSPALPTLLASATSLPETLPPTGQSSPTPSWTATGLAPTIVTGTPIPTGTAWPALQINEVHADPDALLGDSNRDGEVDPDDDEFLELVNLSGEDLDLTGWEVHDSVRLRFTFPEGAVLKPGCGLVIFGGGSPAADFGGSLVFTAGSLGLNNTGDSLVVLDQLKVLVSGLTYGEEGGQNQSLTRSPDLFGSLPLVLHSSLEEADGELFSPGLRVDGSPFGVCP